MLKNTPAISVILSCSFIIKLFCKSDKKPFGSANVAESIRVFVLDHFANKLGTMLDKPRYHLVNVFDSEHNA